MVAGRAGPKPGGKKPGKADKPDLRVVGGGQEKPRADAEGMARAAGINMNDENERALFFQNLRRHEALLAVLNKAQADVRNHGKRVKSEMGERGMEIIKLAIKLKAETGIKDLQEEVRLREKVARWMGMPLGSQGDFDFTDRRPLAERAYEEGKVAGMEGRTYANPHDINSEAGKCWDKGWKDGQEAIFAIGPMRTEGDGSEIIKGDGSGKALDPIEEDAGERQSEGDEPEEGEGGEEDEGGHPEADDDDERRKIAQQRAEDEAAFADQ